MVYLELILNGHEMGDPSRKYKPLVSKGSWKRKSVEGSSWGGEVSLWMISKYPRTGVALRGKKKGPIRGEKSLG